MANKETESHCAIETRKLTQLARWRRGFDGFFNMKNKLIKTLFRTGSYTIFATSIILYTMDAISPVAVVTGVLIAIVMMRPSN